MFKSAETLRLAAEMRALQKVASPWREARTTWFDGSPESIEARIAATERVLTFARSGYTGAHMALEREAAHARAELIEAKHRLLTDFLDDSARSFQGSRRVAGKHDADPEMPWKNRATGEDTPTEHWENLRLSPFDDVDDYEGKHREAGAPILDLSSHGGETGSSTSLRHRDDKENNRFTLRHPEGYGDRARVVTNHDDTEMMSADGVHHWAGLREIEDPDYGIPAEHEINPYTGEPGRSMHFDGDGTGAHWDSNRHYTHDDPRRAYENTIMDQPYFDMMYTPDFADLPLDGDYQGRHRSEARRRIAAPMTSVGEGGSSLAGMGSEMMGGQGSAVSTSLPGAIAKGVWSGSTTTGQEPTPAFNPGPKAASLRLAAAEFIDAQNTRDRDELAFRAARHVAGMTGHLPRPVAEAAGQVFVAAVLAGCDCDKDRGCEDCGAESGEDCRPWCTGQAAHEDEKADRTKKGHRTAAVLTDFADELLF